MDFVCTKNSEDFRTGLKLRVLSEKNTRYVPLCPYSNLPPIPDRGLLDRPVHNETRAGLHSLCCPNVVLNHSMYRTSHCIHACDISKKEQIWKLLRPNQKSTTYTYMVVIGRPVCNGEITLTNLESILSIADRLISWLKNWAVRCQLLLNVGGTSFHHLTD